MKTIPLSRGMVAIIDDCDFGMVSKHKWHFCDGYARSAKAGAMHRFILSAPKGMQVDHRNHNTLDNRRENIWICTASENQKNNRRWNPRITTPTLRHPQLKIGSEIAKEIDEFRKCLPFRVSRSACVEMLIRSGMVAHKTVDKLNAIDEKYAAK